MEASQISNPQLRSLAERVEAARQESRKVLSGLSQTQLDWQPAPGRWGVGQCIEHLVISDEKLIPGVREALAGLKARGGAPVYEPWKMGIRGGLLIRSIDVETGKRKVKTGRPFIPGPAARPDLRGAVEKDLDNLQELIAAADGLDVRKARVVSPVTRFITYHVGDALTIMVVHWPRHLAQAERVKREPAFPRA
jgi:hypothetical protein